MFHYEKENLYNALETRLLSSAGGWELTAFLFHSRRESGNEVQEIPKSPFVVCMVKERGSRDLTELVDESTQKLFGSARRGGELSKM